MSTAKILKAGMESKPRMRVGVGDFSPGEHLCVTIEIPTELIRAAPDQVALESYIYSELQAHVDGILQLAERLRS